MVLRAMSCVVSASYYTKVYVQTIGPLSLLGLLSLAFVKTRNPVWYDLLLFISFIVYPSTSATLIQYFDCYRVWHGVHGTGGTNYLLVDPDILCTDDAYLSQAFFYVLPMTAIFVVGFPVYYGKLVWGDRKFIHPQCPNTKVVDNLTKMQNKVIVSEAELNTSLIALFGIRLSQNESSMLFNHWREGHAGAQFNTRRGDGSATSGTKPCVRYSRLVQLFDFGRDHERWRTLTAVQAISTEKQSDPAMREPILYIAPLALRNILQRHAIQAHKVLRSTSKAQRERWVMRAREHDVRAQRSAFLWRAYRPKYYWFEVMDLLRKFLLTGLPLILNSVFPNAATLSLAVGLLASILSMGVYSVLSPYADQQDSYLMLPAQLQATITMICGMLMKYAAGDWVAELVISLIVILSFLPIIALGLYLLWDPFQKPVCRVLSNLRYKVYATHIFQRHKFFDTFLKIAGLV